VVRASARFDLQAGDRFLLQSAGGGGYGDPHERDAAALADDIAERRVTPEAAERDYGRKIL
jgi:N-methylhydantoinase B